MTKQGPTPAPWKCEAVGYPQGKDISFEILDAKRGVIAQTLMREIGDGWRNDIIAVDEANAHLIAAAPVMLSALKKIAVLGNDGKLSLEQYVRKADDIACEAIAEAEGC